MYFDSPIELCVVCKRYVLLDQTQKECALEHQCRRDERCPLAKYFTGKSFEPEKKQLKKLVASAEAGATFDRFGIFNMQTGGWHVEFYLDDLQYRARRDK